MAEAPRAPVVFLLDAASAAVFIALGRRTHSEEGVVGYLQALWPFLVALVLGWLILKALTTRPGQGFSPGALWPGGVVVWLITAGGGLGIRWLAGGGLAGGFPYVTFAVLGAFMLAWRLVRWWVGRSRQD